MRRFHLYALAVAAILAIVCAPTGSAHAANASEWQAGRIIDDEIFNNKDTMSPDQIQQFLNSKVPTCDTNGTKTSEYGGGTRAQYGAAHNNPAPYTCVKDYYENPTTHDNNLSGRPVPAGGLSAAQIIYQAAQQYNINPQVLIVLLQKEQTLVTDEWPFLSQYRSATGYGCPDTAACDANYYGFYNQVVSAAWQFRYYANHPNNFNFIPGQSNSIRWSPNSSCGAGQVFIGNQATASLYDYTPYQPNAAALNNLYGSGDSCSAYGNRNFWRLFTDWFGSTLFNDTYTAHPDGTLINMNGAVYLIENYSRKHVRASVFASRMYNWNSVKSASLGDKNMGESGPLDFRPGSLLFDGNAVYVAVLDTDGAVKRQHLSYGSFVSLGYSWNDVQSVNSSELPAIAMAGYYTGGQHPRGTLISLPNDPKVYEIDINVRRHVSYSVFTSYYGGNWSVIKNGTSQDAALPEDTPMLFREGSLLSDGYGIYAVDYDLGPNSAKRHIATWVCFADRFHFTTQDVINVSAPTLPTRDGADIAC